MYPRPRVGDYHLGATMMNGRMTTLKRHNNNNNNNPRINQIILGRNVRSRTVEDDDYCVIKPTKTTTVIENLDNNLLGEILILVPAKTVGRLKVINKRWYSLISDPFFINKHTTRSLQITPYHACNFFWQSPTRPGDVIHLSLDRSSPSLLTETTISLGEEVDFSVIKATCHGLLLVKMYAPISTLCFFNPLTKKQKIIPFPYKCKTCNFGLVPTSSSSSSSLDYHYTVVCMVRVKTTFEFKIFMSEKGFWRDCHKSTRISHGNYSLGYQTMYNPVCFRGTIHWLIRQGFIVAFNLEKEESSIIEIPKSVFEMVGIIKYEVEMEGGIPETWWTRAWLGVVDDEINLAVVTPEYEIVTWVLCDYENKKWQIKRKDVIKTERDPEGYIHPMYFDGQRFFLNFKKHLCPRSNNWQELDVVTGVLRSLLDKGPRYCYPGISTLIEV